jgi:hypothetical protein
LVKPPTAACCRVTVIMNRGAHLRGRKAAGNPVGFAGGNRMEDSGRCDGARHLREDGGENVGCLEAASGPEPDGDGAIEMSAGDVADRRGHRQHRQAEGEADPYGLASSCARRRWIAPGSKPASASSIDSINPQRLEQIVPLVH